MVLLAASTALFLGAVWMDATPLLRGPAPYPPDWRWLLVENRTLHRGGLALASTAGLILLLWATGRTWAAARPRLTATILLASATILGAGLQVGLLEPTHESGAVGALVSRTENPQFTGFFTVAASEWAADPIWFLRNHARMLEDFQEHAQRTGRVGIEHVQTHPPGAILYYRIVIEVCDAFPGPREALARIANGARVDPRLVRGPRDPARRAAALVAPILLMLLGAATCFPIAAMAGHLGLRRSPAARVGIVSTAVPSCVLMVPEIDQLVMFLGAVAVALFWASLRERRERTVASPAHLAVLGGVVAGTGIFVSYGAIFYVSFGALLAAIVRIETRSGVRLLANRIGLAVGGALAPLALLGLLGHDPIATARMALGTHFADYAHQRDYWLWLGFNLWDFAVFFSIPLTLLGLGRFAASVRSATRREPDAWLSPITRFHLGAVALLMLLNASGLVRGETGRSWMPLVPFLLLAATVRQSGDAPTASRSGVGPSDSEAVFLTCLLLVYGWALRTCWQVP
jgi:hypothetical protein